MTHDLSSPLDKGGQMDMVFLDFANEFNCVSQQSYYISSKSFLIIIIFWPGLKLIWFVESSSCSWTVQFRQLIHYIRSVSRVCSWAAAIQPILVTWAEDFKLVSKLSMLPIIQLYNQKCKHPLIRILSMSIYKKWQAGLMNGNRKGTKTKLNTWT